ncbi:phenylacetate--CoA ligase family protein [Pseudomonas sp. TWP3-2]|uniref:phenylacetate--CoA ligase family protein n=1 Tax=Pseudomonas sp. TWP3-2 TaxID=2804574 RepID=UPI003CE9E4EA
MNDFIELNELVAFAREHSSFYREHFTGVPEHIRLLSELPIVDPVAYWKDSHDLDQWPVLSCAISNALIYKTGGTTGEGRFSVFDREEWRMLVQDFGNSLAQQLNAGDRVANLFFVGDLYASFIFVHDALAHAGPGVVEFPFTGMVEPAVLAEAIAQQRINVLAGVPAQLLTFAAWLDQHDQTLYGVETLLYGGESLFPAQLQLLGRVFPNVRVASMGYASVDAGFLGASHLDCILGEHRTPDGHSVLEIIDEHTGEVITECDRIGMLVTTNLTRRLMPMIRYPVGDRACWREPCATPMRKFALLGRSADSQRVRVGILTLLTRTLGELVQRCTGSVDWQLVIEQTGRKDVLSVKWAPVGTTLTPAEANRALRQALIEHYPLIDQLRADQLLDLHTQCCPVEALSRHPRSGKHRQVIDLREYDSSPQELSSCKA